MRSGTRYLAVASGGYVVASIGLLLLQGGWDPRRTIVLTVPVAAAAGGGALAWYQGRRPARYVPRHRRAPASAAAVRQRQPQHALQKTSAVSTCGEGVGRGTGRKASDMRGVMTGRALKLRNASRP
jgi:hypothetical protein